VSAVAEREVGATFEELTQALDQKREKLRERSAKLLDLVQEEQVALDEFLRLTPDKNPWVATTKPQRRHDEVVKCEREISNLEREIGTLVVHVTREAALRDVENLKAKTAEIEKLNRATARRLKEAGAAFETFVLEQWNPYAELLEQRAALRGEVTPETLRSCSMLDPEAASRWAEVSVAPETPRTGAPPDVGAFCEMLIEVMLDPGNAGYRAEAGVVETNFASSDMKPLPGEPRHTRTVVEGGNRKYPRRLAELLPDLRGKDARVEARDGVGVGLFGLNQWPKEFSAG
jgi:hypothetical protein